MDLTIAQENNVTLLQDWINFYKPYCRLIDVPADGICGWFCLAASAEYLRDYTILRLENGTGWKLAAWEQMTVMLNGVVWVMLNRFGNQWGNVVAKVIKRRVVVVGENVGGKENFVFTLHTPRFINGYNAFPYVITRFL